MLRPPQGPRSRRKFQLATLGAVAALALVGGAAAAAAGMGFGNVGAPASACDIPLSAMNEAFDSNTSFVTADWGGGPDARIAKRVRCDYVQSPRSQDDDGVVEVNALRQEPPDPMYLSMLQSTVGLSGGVRGERSSIPIVITNGGEGDNGGGYMLCMSGDALWMVIVYDDPSGITYAGLDAVANAIGCEPQP